MKFARSFWLWCAALVIIGAFAFALHPHGSTRQARITHLETLVRCPSCDDLSVGVSNATSAIAVRHEIVKKVDEGKTDNQILTSLESVYGTSILLAPPTSGIGALLWIGPVVVFLLLVGSAIRLTRRR